MIDLELSEEATSGKSMFDVPEEQINPVRSVVEDQIYSCLNMVTYFCYNLVMIVLAFGNNDTYILKNEL